MEEEKEQLAPDLDSILNGSFDFTEEAETEENKLEENEDANIEDTDANSEEELDEDTNDQDADSDDDTSDDLDDDSSEEDAQEDDLNSKDDDSDEDDSEDGADEASNDDSGTEEEKDSDEKGEDEEDGTEPTSGSEEEKDSDGIDYKAFYDKVVNSEFKANGKPVKGFSDPEKIIRAQQMLYGYEEKMAGFKQYRPLIGSLKKSGMVDNPDKFNMMMDIMNGDKEALKQLIKTQNIDPITDLDLDNINYSGNNYVDSKESIDVEDTIEIARNLGIEDKFRETVGKQWDDESFNEFTSKPQVREDLLMHMSNKLDEKDENSPTIYDAVQEKISEMKVLDTRGTFRTKSSINQYREAVSVLARERRAAAEKEQALNKNIETKKPESNTPKAPSKSEVEAEKAKILEKRKEEEYKQKVKEKEKLEAEKRKKASSASKTKPSKTQKKPKFDPLKLEGEEFRKYFESIGRS